jgi:hypothetical protein
VECFSKYCVVREAIRHFRALRKFEGGTKALHNEGKFGDPLSLYLRALCREGMHTHILYVSSHCYAITLLTYKYTCAQTCTRTFLSVTVTFFYLFISLAPLFLRFFSVESLKIYLVFSFCYHSSLEFCPLFVLYGI